ncbi:ABC-2 type transport system ATP-binding protein [Parasphingorhabdus marina DSM 22363]|uniref:ABC-2 type transport system ATP-binding protein n=1 Tax=Parasphingorhabdus marina DSM 22363 TaxID=1123272 RepID=A0A1N6D279_9SPHN|nr:ABC transporter ATP-binding protein [Parasphingorhabdus marina]SIN64813.1 ABC-2 type transport system ATP-binding protein [Parasphingorhabdus marina DSM 22363]
MNSPLETRSLSLKREGNAVLDKVSFTVAQGEIFALLGGNGAGKSSTLLTFLGFLEPSGGEVLVNGQSVASDVTAARNAIAYLPEATSLYGHMTAYENLDYFLDLAGRSAGVDELNAAFDRVALPIEARSRRLQSYSKGMRQKTAIALALLRETPILLLDEPTSGLDPVAIDEFHDLVKALAQGGQTILMVTHDVYGACQVADRVGLLRRGKLVGSFSAENGQRIDTETVHAAFAEREAA